MDGDVSAIEGGFYLGSEDSKTMGAPPVKVDRVLKDGDKVSLEGIELTANLTPGHSRGCTSWGAKTTEAGKTYDVLVFCSATVAANRITPPLQYAGIVEDYRATFAKVKTMKADIPLAPHPEFFGLLEKKRESESGEIASSVCRSWRARDVDREAGERLRDDAERAHGEGAVAPQPRIFPLAFHTLSVLSLVAT
jgi:metallo-beta-lactamase class B